MSWIPFIPLTWAQCLLLEWALISCWQGLGGETTNPSIVKQSLTFHSLKSVIPRESGLGPKSWKKLKLFTFSCVATKMSFLALQIIAFTRPTLLFILSCHAILVMNSLCLRPSNTESNNATYNDPESSLLSFWSYGQLLLHTSSEQYSPKAMKTAGIVLCLCYTKYTF